MAYTPENIDKIKAQMRQLMVRDPRISGRRMSDVLGYDRNFICKLKRKLDREITVSIERSLMEKDLGQLQIIYETMVSFMWDIVNDADAKDKDKINAFKAIIDGKDKLIDRKMDAGIFNRKLGDLKVTADLTPEQSELINMGLEKLYGVSRKTKTSEGESGDKKGVGKK